MNTETEDRIGAPTKRVEYYVDLNPGWQDMQFCPDAHLNGISGLPSLYPGCVRVRILVDLPCFGGTMDTSSTVEAETKEDRNHE